MSTSDAEIDTGAPQEMAMKKYQTYKCKVDPDQDDKALEIKICDFSRPHMRAFHCSWFAFFMAFFIWFAITPLLAEIQITLDLTKKQLWTSSICGVAGTVFMRFILGPACDKYGARILFAVVLCVAAIPVACTGAINSATGLYILRLFIGIAGGTFVMCQYWTSRMFAKSVVGTANAVSAGWGNAGGGVTQLVVGSLLFPLFKVFFQNYPDPAEMAWRTVCIVPAVFAFATGVTIYLISDDAPTGNYAELKKTGMMPEVSAAASFRSGSLNVNTWILCIQYGCCFGVELTMHNAAALYFRQEFALSTESAAAIASIFGFMCIIARPLGGYISDKLNARYGMRGRIWGQTVYLALEGVFVIIFAQSHSLGVAIFVMVLFSICVQGATGTSYGIVPYIDPPSTGSISGIVGAGGNLGAVGFGLAFRQMSYEDAFVLMGCVVLGSAFLSAGIFIKGHAGLICGQDSEENKAAALAVPEPDEEGAAEVNKEVEKAAPAPHDDVDEPEKEPEEEFHA